jgi:curli biogenesis system outer membrane secretion channel CsgG
LKPPAIAKEPLLKNLIPWVSGILLFSIISCAADNVAVRQTEPVYSKKQTPRFSSPDKALDYLARALRQKLPSGTESKYRSKPLVIAITDFITVEGRMTRLGRYISDKLTPYFTSYGEFSVQERALIDSVIREQKFQTSPFVDEESTQQVGKLIGAETIITGTIAELGKAYYINAKVVGVIRGNVLTSIDVEIKKTGMLEDLFHSDLPRFKEKKSKIFRAQGIGIPSPKHKNPTLARSMAVRAAKGVAMRNLVEKIYAVQVSSQTTIKDMVAQDDSIRLRLNSTIQGARVIDQRQLPDGGVEVEMEVELTEEFLQALQSK